MPTTVTLHDAEDQLRAAMLAGDVAALDALLADDLLFVSPAGQGVGKSEDLAMHRSGRLRLHRVDTRILSTVAGERTAVTEVEAVVGGTFDGASFEGAYLYTRMWRLDEGRWRVTAALCKEHPGTP